MRWVQLLRLRINAIAINVYNKTLRPNLLHKYLMNQSHFCRSFRPQQRPRNNGWHHKRGSIKFYAPYGIISLLRLYCNIFYVCNCSPCPFSLSRGQFSFEVEARVESQSFCFGGEKLYPKGNSWQLLGIASDKLWNSLEVSLEGEQPPFDVPTRTAFYDFWFILFVFRFSDSRTIAVKVYAPRSLMTYYEEFVSLMEWGSDSCEQLLAASEHIDVLFELSRDRKFDVLITEYFNTDCALGLAYKLNITSFIGMVCRTFYCNLLLAFLRANSFVFGEISRAVHWCRGTTIASVYPTFPRTFPTSLWGSQRIWTFLNASRIGWSWSSPKLATGEVWGHFSLPPFP